MGGRVPGVTGAPTGLRLLPTGSLAVRLTASVLAVADSHVWPEPPPADLARSLPGIGHARSSSPQPGGQLLVTIGGSYVERRIMLSQGPCDVDAEIRMPLGS